MLFKTVKGKKEFHPKTLEFIKNDDDKLIPLLQNMGSICKDAADSSGTTLLHLAARHGNSRLTLYLKRLACEIDARDQSGSTPLMVAVHHQQLEQVQLLLVAKAGLNLKDNSGDSVLRITLKYATIRTGYIIMTVILKTIAYIKDRKEIIQILKDADCPIYRAVFANDPEVIAMYIDSGAPINMQNREPISNNRNTALHMGAMLNDAPMVEMLLEKGADATIRNIDNYTPFMISLHYTASMKIEDITLLCKNVENNVKSWIARGSDGKLMLHPIFAKSARHTLKLFLKTYTITDLNAKDIHGMTPLHYLAENPDTKAIDVAENFELNVNAQDESGRTPLHVAMLRAAPDVVQFLLKKGANVHMKDNEGRTPLFYAFLESSKKAEYCDGLTSISLLMLNGADPQVFSKDKKTVIGEGLKSEEYNDRLEPVVAQLAMSEKLGKPIDCLIRKQIIADFDLKIYYRSCRVQLQAMMEHVIYDSVTLFNILTDDDVKLAEYAEKPGNVRKILETSREKVSDWHYRFVLAKKYYKIAELGGMEDLYEERQKIVIDKLTRDFLKTLNI